MNNLRKLIILNDTRIENHHGCSRVMNCIDFYIKSHISDITHISVGEDWQKNELLKRKLVSADIIIVNGEGTIHHNAPMGFSLIKVAKFVSQYGVKCYLINTTYQENNTSYKHYLEYFESIHVRESYSQAELNKIGITSTIVPDLTFSYIPDEIEAVKNEKIYLTCSVKNYIKIYFEEEFGQNKDVLFSSIFNDNIIEGDDTSIIDRIISILRNNNASQLACKLKEVIRNKVDKTDNIIWHSQNTHLEYSDFLAQAKLVVCARFHAMTICMNHAIPFMAIESNSHKVQGTLVDIGLDLKRFLVKPDELTLDYLNQFKITDAESELIRNYSEQAKKSIDNMFHDIFNKEA